MFCNLDKLMTSLLCFLHYIIDQFHNNCDKKFYLIPCDKMSGKGGVSGTTASLSEALRLSEETENMGPKEDFLFW